MYRIIGMVILSFIVIGTAQAEWLELKTKADFDKYVVGKTIGYEKCNLVLQDNRRLTGKCGTAVSKITWEIKNGMYCRKGYMGKSKLEPDCQKFEVNGKKLRITRDYGKGKSGIWNIK